MPKPAPRPGPPPGLLMNGFFLLALGLYASARRGAAWPLALVFLAHWGQGWMIVWMAARHGARARRWMGGLWAAETGLIMVLAFRYNPPWISLLFISQTGSLSALNAHDAARPAA